MHVLNQVKMSSSVHVNEQVVITPSQPTPNHILQLSALDSQLFTRFTFDYLLVFEPRPEIDKDLITNNVKSALARALVPYYPLAGRVKARPDDRGLEVFCDAQGALFIEATTTSTVSDFDGAPPHAAHWRQLLSVKEKDVLGGGPPLIVQLTWLGDGGATLAVAFSHCLCDGTGGAQFLNSFAKLALGSSEVDQMPTWSRHLLDTVVPFRDDSVSLPEFGSVPDLCEFNARFVGDSLIPISTIFDKTRLNELKESTQPTHHTSFEVLSGHVWRSWARSVNLPSTQVVRLLFPVNVRQRVTPSLPSGYYGNAFVMGCAEACMEDLVGEGLSYAAELVARAKERVGDEHVRAVLDAVSWKKRASVDSVGTLVMTQWSRLGLEGVDFGMGNPVQVSPVCSSKFFKLLPVCGQPNALKVNLAVPPTAVDQFLNFLTNIHL